MLGVVGEMIKLREALIKIRDTPKGDQDLCWKIATEALGEGEKTWNEWDKPKG